MSNQKGKFKYSTQHVHAILHMIGQCQDTFGHKPTTAEVASWMNVTKATARKHLKRMEENGKLIMNKVEHRPLVYKHTWQLSVHEYDKYKAKQFTMDYHFYVQKVLGLILQ